MLIASAGLVDVGMNLSSQGLVISLFLCVSVFFCLLACLGFLSVICLLCLGTFRDLQTVHCASLVLSSFPDPRDAYEYLRSSTNPS